MIPLRVLIALNEVLILSCEHLNTLLGIDFRGLLGLADVFNLLLLHIEVYVNHIDELVDISGDSFSLRNLIR